RIINIRSDENCLLFFFVDHATQMVTLFHFDVNDGHSGTFVDKVLYDSSADTTGTAGNDSHFISQSVHKKSSYHLDIYNLDSHFPFAKSLSLNAISSTKYMIPSDIASMASFLAPP